MFVFWKARMKIYINKQVIKTNEKVIYKHSSKYDYSLIKLQYICIQSVDIGYIQYYEVIFI